VKGTKRLDLTGTACCLECGASAVHERGPGTPLILRHAVDCSPCPSGNRTGRPTQEGRSWGRPG
jgi:hypothetical protein